jgi:hypothetical protein
MRGLELGAAVLLFGYVAAERVTCFWSRFGKRE